MTEQKKKPDTSTNWPATVVACCGLAAVVAVYGLSSPEQRDQLLAGVAVLWGVVQAFLPAIRKWAGVSTVLVLVLAGATLSGCGASLGTVVGVGTLVVEGTCGGAAKLCEALDPACGGSACQVAHDVCSALPIDAHVQLACEQPATAGGDVAP